MPKNKPVQLCLHTPQTPEDQRALARHIAQVHADGVIGALERLSCPPEQKAEILDRLLQLPNRP